MQTIYPNIQNTKPINQYYPLEMQDPNQHIM